MSLFYNDLKKSKQDLSNINNLLMKIKSQIQSSNQGYFEEGNAEKMIVLFKYFNTIKHYFNHLVQHLNLIYKSTLKKRVVAKNLRYAVVAETRVSVTQIHNNLRFIIRFVDEFLMVAERAKKRIVITWKPSEQIIEIVDKLSKQAEIYQKLVTYNLPMIQMPKQSNSTSDGTTIIRIVFNTIIINSFLSKYSGKKN